MKCVKKKFKDYLRVFLSYNNEQHLRRKYFSGWGLNGGEGGGGKG